MSKDSKNIEKQRGLARGELMAIVLATIAGAGMLSLLVAAPNILQVVKLFKKNDQRYKTPTYVRKVVERMFRQKLLVLQRRGNEEVFVLSDKGRKVLLRYRLKEGRQGVPKRWDKQWRIIIFDIEEEKRWTRDWIRQQIQEFGFYKLQQSVWIYPYECEEFVALIKGDSEMGKEILYIVAHEVENEERLKKVFNL